MSTDDLLHQTLLSILNGRRPAAVIVDANDPRFKDVVKWVERGYIVVNGPYPVGGMYVIGPFRNGVFYSALFRLDDDVPNAMLPVLVVPSDELDHEIRKLTPDVDELRSRLAI